MTTYHALMTRLINLHNIELCDCKKGQEVYYLYTIYMLQVFAVDSTIYPHHNIMIIETDKKRKEKTATIYNNLNRKDTIPKSGWKPFFTTMDSLNLSDMVAHYASIPCTAIKSTDPNMTLFLYCNNGSLRPHIMMENLDIVTSVDTTPEMYKEMQKQLNISRRLLELFSTEF